MSHPTLPDAPPTEVAESAFQGLWRHRGWVEAKAPAVEVDTPETPARKGRNSQPPAGPGAGNPDKEQ